MEMGGGGGWKEFRKLDISTAMLTPLGVEPHKIEDGGKGGGVPSFPTACLQWAGGVSVTFKVLLHFVSVRMSTFDEVFRKQSLLITIYPVYCRFTQAKFPGKKNF